MHHPNTRPIRGLNDRAIKSRITRKFEEFLASIENEALRKAVGENTIITGGAIVSMAMGEKVNDFDLYFRSADVAHRVAEYFVERFKSEGNAIKHQGGQEAPVFVERLPEGHTMPDGQPLERERIRIVVKSAGIASEGGADDYAYFEQRDDVEGESYVNEAFGGGDEIHLEDADETPAEAIEEALPKYRPVFLSGNAISLSGHIQLIVRFFGEPDEIHENYDFVHCTCYWTSWDKKLVMREEAMRSMLARELVYQGSRYPLCSIIRTRKFIKRGWKINAGQYLKMCMQVSELDLTSISVLEEQLTGVDAAYFLQLIDRIRAANANSGKEGAEADKVDSAYVVSIIDRIF